MLIVFEAVIGILGKLEILDFYWIKVHVDQLSEIRLITNAESMLKNPQGGRSILRPTFDS